MPTRPTALLCRLAVCLALLSLAAPLSAQTVERATRGPVESAVVRLSPSDGLRAGPGLALSPEGLTATDAGRTVVHRIDVPLGAPEPFLGVAVRWSAAGPASDAVRLRTSEQGWATLTAEAHARDGAQTVRSVHTTAPPSTRWIEIEVPVPHRSSLQSVEVYFASPGASTGPAVGRASSAPARPPVVSRTDWQCPDGQLSPDWTPKPIEVTHIALHHTAGGGAFADYAAYVRFVWDLHTNVNGWGDIGYNYLVDPNGVIYEGRAGGSETVDIQGAHALGNGGATANPYSMGVALIGSYTSTLPSVEARDAFVALAAWKVAQKDLDAEGSALMPTVGTLPVLFGHRDLVATECPGGALYDLLPAIRTSVADAATSGSILPNLTLSGCTVRSRGGLPGAPLAFGCTVHNDGASRAGATELGAYVSSDAVFSLSDVLIGTVPVGSIAQGQSVPVRGTASVPPSSASSYLLLVADRLDAVGESNEGDNVVSLRFTTQAACTPATGEAAGVCTAPGSWVVAEEEPGLPLGVASPPPDDAEASEAIGTQRAAASALSLAAMEGFALTSVFPNPVGARASVGLTLVDASSVRVEVVDALGRRVRAGEERLLDAGTHTLWVLTQDLAPGPYVLAVTTDRGRSARAFAVAR